jgi:hypothetical protein
MEGKAGDDVFFGTGDTFLQIRISLGNKVSEMKGSVYLFSFH